MQQPAGDPTLMDEIFPCRRSLKSYFKRRKASGLVEFLFCLTVFVGIVTGIYGTLVTTHASKVIFTVLNFGLYILSISTVVVEYLSIARKCKERVARFNEQHVRHYVSNENRSFNMEQIVKWLICIVGLVLTFLELRYRIIVVKQKDKMYQYCFTAVPILLGLESLIVRGLQYHQRTISSVTCLIDNPDLEVEDYQVFFSDVYPYGYVPPPLSRYGAFLAPVPPQPQGAAVPPIPPQPQGAAVPLIPPQPLGAAGLPIDPRPIPLYSQFVRRTVEGNAAWTHATTYRSFSFRLPVDGVDVPFNFLERSGSHRDDWSITKVDCVIFTIGLMDDEQIEFIAQKIDSLRQHSPATPIVLVGDTDPHRRRIDVGIHQGDAAALANDIFTTNSDRAMTLAETMGLDLYVELNLRTGDNVRYLVEAIAHFCSSS